MAPLRRGVLFPKIFNVVFNGVVRHYLFLTVEDGAVFHDKLVHEVGKSLGVFYVGDECLGSWDP